MTLLLSLEPDDREYLLDLLEKQRKETKSAPELAMIRSIELQIK